jgi:hypothetical protein
MLRLVFFLTLLVHSSTLGHAQAAGSVAKVQFSITRFDPLDRPAPKLMVKNGSVEAEVEVPMTYIAGPYTATLRDGMFLDFYQPGGEMPFLSTKVPAEWQKDLLLIVVPNEKSYEILKVHAPLTSVPGGAHYTINATANDVAIKFGSQKTVLIRSKKSAVLHDPSAGNALTVPAVIRQKDGDQWKLVTTENWPHDRRFRTFLFLFQSSRDQHMAFHGITQRVD